MAERYSDSLNREASNHTDAKSRNSFSCSHCKATFNRAAHLRRHEKKRVNPTSVSHGSKSRSFSLPDALTLARSTEHRQSTAHYSTDGPLPQEYFLQFAQPEVAQDHFLDPALELQDEAAYSYDLLGGTGFPTLPDFNITLSPSGMIQSDEWVSEPRSSSDSEHDSWSPSSFREDCQSEVAHARCLFSFEEEEYLLAQESLSRYGSAHLVRSFQIPSKYAMTRFVKAFFNHMAPHLPIIHRPTFRIGTTPCKSGAMNIKQILIDYLFSTTTVDSHGLWCNLSQ
ncbi:hypothetical protein B0J12DRAFT_700732 [Macrophomina phaseolina]|uniref:C2H2-type domain-containing protein n=1 Tax=Macrophomina phaseolina TaxID=35725 RepID=A0ABQ8G7J8_9PEZI|nr:hypothetical protein B0J12DRAFT_700732 [Macrophomina phaseolina]